eukprot:1149766-Pelagomonas_calceolata.AAC.5
MTENHLVCSEPGEICEQLTDKFQGKLDKAPFWPAHAMFRPSRQGKQLFLNTNDFGPPSHTMPKNEEFFTPKKSNKPRGLKLAPKHLEHERICQAKLVQNWKSGERSIYPQSEHEVLFSMLLKYALPSFGAQAWACAFLGPVQAGRCQGYRLSCHCMPPPSDVGAGQP